MTMQTGGNFFVIGLPRSRTAWLATYLSGGDQFCFHEGVNGCHSMAEYIKKLGHHHGDSGTGLMLFDMNSLFPDAPMVVIERDPQFAIDFCYRTYGCFDPKGMLFLQERLDLVHALRVPYDDINNRLEDIWEHLIGDGFDQQRAEMLIKLDIQVVDPFDIDDTAAKALFHEYSLSKT